MIYRPMQKTDLSAVARLEEVCFQAERWSEEMFLSSFSQTGFVGEVCQNDRGEIVGYGCISCVFDTADLYNIAVAPEYRRTGMGRTILRRLIASAKARGVEKMFLEVRPSNTSANRLYQSEGFFEISVRKKYYPDGEDAYVMRKSL